MAEPLDYPHKTQVQRRDAMIDRISSTGSIHPATGSVGKAAEDAAVETANALVRAFAAQPIGAPLLPFAQEASALLGTALGPATPVESAGLENAVLEFGREAKSFAIAHPELGPESVSAEIMKAVEDGRTALDALPQIAFSPHDKATALFEQATAALANRGQVPDAAA